MKLFILNLLFAAASANYTTWAPKNDLEPSNIITNGQPATEGQAPYMVFLMFRGKSGRGASMCGGSIIGNTWVLTAAHCTRAKSMVTIYYGSLQRAQGQVLHTVTSNNFRRRRRHDIAVIRTPHVEFNTQIKSVRLPSLNDHNSYENQIATACGWGETTSGFNATALQCVDMQVMSHRQCRRAFGRRTRRRRVLCASTAGGKSICFGDSGGPLVLRDQQILIGVSSFVGSHNCTSRRPAGFARVTRQLKWIRRHTGISY